VTGYRDTGELSGGLDDLRAMAADSGGRVVLVGFGDPPGCPGCGSVDTGRILAGDTYCIECNADRVHAGALVDCGESECRRIWERDAAILAEAAATGGTVVVDIPVDEIADRCRHCGDIVEWETLHLPGDAAAGLETIMPACKSGHTLAGSVDVIHF